MMTRPNPGSDRVRFDDFEADLRTEELFKSGRKLRLPHQSFQVLAVLLERAGQLVTREELRTRLWPADTLVEYDQGLNAAVKRLREALRDSADGPRFIETLPKRGYRFIATIQRAAPSEPATSEITAEPAAPAPPPPTPDESRHDRKNLFVPVAALVVLFVAGTLAVTLFRSTTRPPLSGRVVPFTSLPGQEIAPTFSPDGSQIAFAWNGGAGAANQFDLYVKSLGSERLLRLTRQPTKRITPSWSPDGTSIAFAREDDQRSGIYVIPALGGAERRIVDTGLVVGPFRPISWSPDGRSLAYSAYGPKGVAQVYIMSLASLQAQPLSPVPECLDDAVNPAFSPDGSQLALICISSEAVYSIYTVQLPQGPMKQLASMLGYPQGLAWSADGSRLIVANDPGDGGELWQLSLKGQLTKLAFGENSSSPAVARDGRLAYVRGRNTINIWRADLTAAQPEESTTRLIYSTLAQTLPRYSPDGTRIAFQSNRTGTTEIWISDAQGTDPERLTSFNGPISSSPSWCSDGRRIAFDSRVSGTTSIYVEDVAERVPREVVTSRRNLSSPVWSTDCRWMFAHDSDAVLYRFPATGGRAKRVTDRPSTHSVVVDDTLIFNVLEPDGVVLWSTRVSGGPEVRLEHIPKLRYDDVWTATRSGIYYTDVSSFPATVHFYDFATRTTRPRMTLKQAPVPAGAIAIDVSADGRWLLYSQVDDEQSEIMLVDVH